jgi:DNA repair protein RadD
MDNAEIAKFFRDTRVNVVGNPALREPQRDAYVELQKHFLSKNTQCYIQLPVGCGKSGLIGLTPFGIAEGRVLIVVPNLTIRRTILTELDISDPNCFYSRRDVFLPTAGPFLTELKPGANIHDCDNAHMVVANIQQFSGENNKWYERLPHDYFDMILVDEGHHNVAQTWARLFEYFSGAKVISYTATPVRSDGQMLLGEKVYSFTYARSMLMGFISTIDAVHVAPTSITFTAKGKTETMSLEQVIQMRDKDWFSKGIALAEECNRHIVQASIKQLNEVRRHGSPRQIIAVACSIRHAVQIAALYHEYGLKAEVLSSEQDEEKREEIEAALRTGMIDVVVQVQMLGEGYNLGTLSVAAVFRPYRSLSPYIQFVGRILRLADPQSPGSQGNRVFVVSHIGLNDERWWNDFANFDKEDQQFFAEFLGAGASTVEGSDPSSPRLTLRPFMRVLVETVDSYLQKGYLKQVDHAMVTEVLETIRSKGFDPLEFGLTEEIMKRRLEMAALAERQVPAHTTPVQPQRRKEALRMRVQQDARSIADVIVNRLHLTHNGMDLVRHYPGRAPSNSGILIQLALAAQNKVMGIATGERENASLEQFQAALDATASIQDGLTGLIKSKIEAKNGQD